MGFLKNKVYIFSLLILILFGCGREPIQQKILKSMAELDRAYVPALVFTNLQKQRESEIALERAQKKWNEFNRKYYALKIKYGVNITDKFWKDDFNKINGLIISAEALIRNEKLEEAHERLEGVREVFKELRHRNGLDYFLDKLTVFHGSMEKILLSLRGKSKLGDKDLEKLRTLFKEAQTALLEAEAAEISPAVFGFNPEKIEAIKKRIREERELLSIFASTLSSKNVDSIFQSAQELKPNFVVLYKAFGDFKSVFEKAKREPTIKK